VDAQIIIFNRPNGELQLAEIGLQCLLALSTIAGDGAEERSRKSL